MQTYSAIEAVEAAPQFGNGGPPGWALVLYSDLLDDEAPHRRLLERIAAEGTEAILMLPDQHRYEDCVEGTLNWDGREIRVYYETILSYLSFWAPTREPVESLRSFILALDIP